MSKILITGANSFVGTNFRKFSKYRDIEEISLLDHRPDSIDLKKFDVVLHLAAIVHQSKKISEEEYMKVNRDLCLRMAEKAKKSGIGQFVFLSTCKVYGETCSDGGILNEDSSCSPNDPYGRSKYEAEIGLRKLVDDKFIVSIIRTPLVYGEGVKANMFRILRLVEKFPLLPFEDINNNRSFTYIENLVGFIDAAIDKKAGGTFLAKDDEALSTTELVTLLSKYLGGKLKLFRLPAFMLKLISFLTPSIFDRLFGSSEFENAKTKEVLSYAPAVSSEEGIKRMVVAYIDKRILDKSHNTITP